MKKQVIRISVFMLLFGCSCAWADDMAAIEKMTGHYLRLYQQGEPGKACELYWNWDRFCARAFGDSYTALKSADQKKAQNLMFKITTAVFTNEDVVAALRTATFANQCTMVRPDGSVVFIFETTFANGAGGGQTILHIEHTKNSARVVDLERDGLMSKKLSVSNALIKDKMPLIDFLTMTWNQTQKTLSDAGHRDNDWLYGTWELAYDPDQGEKDIIVFRRMGTFVVKDPKKKKKNYEGSYEIQRNKVILSLNIKGRVRTYELTVSDDRSRLTNPSGAYYTQISE